MTLHCQASMELDYFGLWILDACLGITLWQAETPASASQRLGTRQYALGTPVQGLVLSV